MTNEEELEKRRDIADAQLRVAEELRHPIAALAALLAYFMWQSWLVSAGVGLGMMLIVPYWYSKAADKAQDDLERATRTGRHYPYPPNVPPPPAPWDA